MRLHSLGFAGYRSFAARGPGAPDRELQRVTLAPLTILLGKNNSGKSTVARLFHHVLEAMGSKGNDPFPMRGPRQEYGRSFREIQHGETFFNPLDLEIDFSAADGEKFTLVSQLNQQGDLSEDRLPELQRSMLNGHSSPPGAKVQGLLPVVDSAWRLREEARELLCGSCHLPPVREVIKRAYPAESKVEPELPESTDAAAGELYRDVELRASVGTWTAENLEGWRIDIEQTLDLVQLMGQRAGRKGNLAYSGQGIQQVLPVVTLCRWRSLGRGKGPFLDIIEQPELHLHDAAHAALGDLLLDSVKDSGRGNFLVETHSDALVLRVRRRVAEGLAPRNVAIYFVEDLGDGSRVKRIALDENGEVDWWPEGVFSESFEEVKAIRLAQRRKGEK